MNYYDILLAKKLEDDRDPQVVGLSVTENGTYSEEGKVYKPVVVNVPLGSKSITANGVYNAASDNLKGYSSVDVHVSGYKISEVSDLPSPIATFTDGSALPMPKLEVAIEPVQEGSGDPSPTNIRPISGWSAVDVTRTGKNLWGGEKLADDIVAKVTNATKNTTNKTVTYVASSMSNIVLYDKFKSNTRYSFYFSTESSSTNVKVVYTDGTQESPVPNTVYVSTANKTIKNLSGLYYSGETTLKYEECGVFEGVITTQDFEPYNGSTITIQLGDTYYGGKLDVVSGVLTVDRAYVDLGTLSWGSASDGRVYSSAIADIKPITASSTVSNIMCSNYATVSARAVYDKTTNGSICIAGAGYGGDKCIGVYDSSLANKSASEVTQAMNGVQLVYELATPTTIQLTPTAIKSLLGTNNLWADTGDVLEASYWEEL